MIDDNGDQLGIMPVEQARALAIEKGVNLVEVAPQASPPVCRIMNYGKFKYDQRKKDKKSKTKLHQVMMKEIRIRPRIESHDLETKLKKARQFLERGDRVLFNMHFRGREMGCIHIGLEVMNKIKELLEELSKVEKEPKMEGRRMTMMLVKK